MLKKCIAVLITLFCVFGCKEDSNQKGEMKITNSNAKAVLASYNINLKKQSRDSLEKSSNPDIQKLKKLKTDYNIFNINLSDAMTALQTVFMGEEENVSNDKTAEFIVTDWGPQKVIPADLEYPEFYVSFNLPIRKLGLDESKIKGEDYFTIFPKVEGVYKFSGTRQISFIPKVQLDNSQVYTISVNEKLKSFDGVKISGDLVFTTTAEELRVRYISGGSELAANRYFSDDSGVPLEYANFASVSLNSEVSANSFYDNIKVYVDDVEVKYETIPAKYDQKVYKNVSTEKSNYHYIKILSKISPNQRIKIVANNDNKVYDYYSLKPLKYDEYRIDTNGKIKFEFNHDIDKKSVKNNIKIIPYVEIKDENIEESYKGFELVKVPFERGKKYKIEILKNLTDKYSQKLSEKIVEDVFIPNKDGYISLSEIGDKILEAKYQSKVILEYQNLKSGKYSVKKLSNPFAGLLYVEGEDVKQLNCKIDNKKYYEEIDLSEYLDNGFGFVGIRYVADFEQWNEWNHSEVYKFTNHSEWLVVQVTDLGVTSRIAYDKAIVMVRSLSTNEPVSGAKVCLCENSQLIHSSESIQKILGSSIATGYTDESGMAVLTIPNMQQQYALKNPVIYVEKGDDKIFSHIQGHERWRSNINYDGITESFKKKSLAFLFSDRGLYKPGEKIKFKGITRELTKDGLKIPKGKYTCKFVSDYNSDEIILEPVSGKVSKSGSFSNEFNLPQDLKPGNYSIEIFLNDEYVYSERIKVSYFEKAKFQVMTSIPDGELHLGDTVNAFVEASYLAGGALVGADYNSNVYKSTVSFTPPSIDARNYVFGPIENSSLENVYQQNGKLSSNGTVEINYKPVFDIEGATCEIKVDTSVVDVSNQIFSSSKSKIVHPGLFYIGIQKNFEKSFPKTNENVDINFKLFNIDGTVTDVTQVKENFEYEIIRQNWEYVNVKSGDELVSRWERKDEKVASGVIEKSSTGKISFEPKKSGCYIVSLKSKDNKNNVIKTQKSFYVTGIDYYWFDFDSSRMINIEPDKDLYKPGEIATLLLKSPLAEGDYLITVERDSILYSEIKHIKGSCSQIQIPIKEDYLPIVYVSIAACSGRTQEPPIKPNEKDFGKPQGCYGVTALNIDLSNVSFDIKIKTDKEEYLPGEEMTIEVEASKNGSPLSDAEVTLMVVDRAVIDLIDYHVNDPRQIFYNKRYYPLTVDGLDSRYNLMNPILYKVTSLQGGDKGFADAAESAGVKMKNSRGAQRSDFRPTAYFEPEIITDKKGKAKVKFKLPDSLTTYRITAFGVVNNLFGLEESEVSAKNPINVQSVQPRRMRTRDTAEAGVIVTNLTDKEQEIKIQMSVRVPEDDYEEDKEKGIVTEKGEAFIDGDNETVVAVAAGETKPVYFNVAAVSKGNVELVYKVQSKGLDETLISRLYIEKPYTYETFGTTGVVGSSQFKKSENLSRTEKIVIPSWCQDGKGELKLTLDATQLGLLNSSVEYVFDYPYGCIEQQSSRILPLLLFKDNIDALGMKSKITNPRTTILSFFKEMKKNQIPNGGFGYWPDSRIPSFFVSLRMLHVYYLALENGFTESEIGYDAQKLKSYIVNEITKLETNNPIVAYACYIFSKFNFTDLNNILDSIYNKIKDEKDFSLTKLSYVGLAYFYNGDIVKAKEIASIIERYIKKETRSISIDVFKNYYHDNGKYFYGMYDNESEGLACMLQLFVELNPSDELVDKILFTLLQEQKKGYWQSTATTAKVFESISVMIKNRNLKNLDFVANAIIKDGSKKIQLMKKSFEGLGALPEVQTISFENEKLKNVSRNKVLDLKIEKSGKGSLYYTALMKYALPDELIQAKDVGFEVSYTIYDMDGNIVKPLSPEDKVIILEQGKEYKVETTIFTPKEKNFVAIRIPIPSGAEIIDTSLKAHLDVYEDSDDNYYNSGYEYFYDNEAQYFINDMNAGTVVEKFSIRAVRKGVYPTPPVLSECMYEPEYYGRSNGYLFIIK